MSATVGRATALLLILAGSGIAGGRAVNDTGLRVFEFTADFFTHVGRCRLKGLMASNGVRHRLAVYWVEPGRLRNNSASSVTACDMLLAEEGMPYWVHGVAESAVLQESDLADIPLLPRQDDVQSVLRSALAIVNYLRCNPEPESYPQHLHRFLQDSRPHPQYTYEYTPDEADKSHLLDETTPDRRIFNTLPLGRVYVKNALSHEMLRWDLRKALTNEPIISIRVKPKAPTREAVRSRPFDAETLGQWRLIPEPYRFYWSCRVDCTKLSTSASPGTAGIEVCDRIKSYLEASQVPDEVRRALEHLWLDTALLAQDMARTRQSLHATVAGFCQDTTVSSDRALVELGRIAAELESHFPKQFKTLLKPVVGLMVKHIREDIEESFSQYTNSISANGGFCYGDMLLEAMRCQGSIDSAAIDALAIEYDAARLVREREPFDRSKSTPTVRQYLDLLDEYPPPGTLTMNDARHVLEKGLGRYYPDGEPKAMQTLVEAIIESLHLIAGAGPFQGEQSELIESTERFSRIYFDVCRNKEPIDMALATFLALSFHDISTPRDHDALCGQITRLSTRFQSQLNARLHILAIHELVTPEDVKGIFQRYYEEEFRGYVDDPLCPAFKFPLTANEEVRLTSKLILRFCRLEPLLEETALKVKYGGISDEIKAKTVYGISRAAEYLLLSMAFLRRPPYPGVLCQYRGGHGIVAVIPQRFYQAGRRPNERFRAMQYFHLGHRLEELVERERELAKQENMRVQKHRH